MERWHHLQGAESSGKKELFTPRQQSALPVEGKESTSVELTRTGVSISASFQGVIILRFNFSTPNVQSFAEENHLECISIKKPSVHSEEIPLFIETPWFETTSSESNKVRTLAGVGWY